MKTNFRESETLELKKSTSELKEAIISIASILNRHQKGKVYFGIKDSGEITGQDVTKNTIREISRLVTENMEPKIYPKVAQIEIHKKSCIQVEFKVRKSGFSTTFFRSKSLLRNAPENAPENLLKKDSSELKIYTLIKKNTKVTTKELSKTLKLDESTIKRNIQKLKQKGLLKRTGPDKGGYWEVK